MATLLVVAVGSLTAVAPAGAYLRDFQSFSASTATNSDPLKSQEYACPADGYSIGTGSSIPLISNLGINNLSFAAGKAVIDGAAETDSEPASWALTARAWCAQNSAVKPYNGGASRYIKSVVIERNQSSTNSSFAKSAIAKCPAGSPTVIGGGGNIDGTTNDVAFDSIQRLAGNQLRVKAHETDATTGSWSVEAHAICANTTTAIAANVYVDAVDTPVAGPDTPTSLNKTFTANCPAGKVIIGGAATVYGSGGQSPPPADVVIKQSRPAGEGASATGWTASAAEVDPTAASWRLFVIAWCAVPNAPPA